MKDWCLWHKTKPGIGFPIYHPYLITCALAATWQKNWPKMKIPNLGFSVFLRDSVSRVYQLQDRSSCRMRSLHYSTLEYTRSFIKIIAKRKKKIFLIPPPVTAAEIRPSRNLAEKTDKKWKFQILVSTCSWAAAQAGSTNCKIVVRVQCGTFTTLPPRILVVSLKELPNERKGISLIPPPITTAEIRPSRNLAEKKLTKNENSKFWSQRVPERQHRQGLPTASSQFV